MSAKQYYHDIDLVKVGQLLNIRVHNVTSAERTALGGTLGAANAGVHVWDTDENQQYYWDGTQWVQGVQTITGAMQYKGAHSDLVNAPSSPEVGHVYRITTAGTLTWAGQTFQPNAEVQVGDSVIYAGSDTWDVYQGDADEATETSLGLVELATQAEVNAGADTTRSVTPATLAGLLAALNIPRTYYEEGIALSALTPETITHNLGLSNKDAFTVRVSNSSGSSISVDVDSVDVNSITLTSFLGLTGVKVAIVGH